MPIWNFSTSQLTCKLTLQLVCVTLLISFVDFIPKTKTKHPSLIKESWKSAKWHQSKAFIIALAAVSMATSHQSF